MISTSKEFVIKWLTWRKKYSFSISRTYVFSEIQNIQDVTPVDVDMWTLLLTDALVIQLPYQQFSTFESACNKKYFVG